MPSSDQALLVTGLYTLSPTHCGTGQAAGAVDLPIAREAHTGLPILPASTLKGIARDDWFDARDKALYRDLVKPLFGPQARKRREDDIGNGDTGNGAEAESLSAGSLVFLDGLLLAFPVRSLTGGFRLVTSPLLLHRLHRIARAQGHDLADGFECPSPPEDEAFLPSGGKGPVSLEDLVFPQERCRPMREVDGLAQALGRLVARDEKDADRKALPKRLVVVADAVLLDLTRRATTVTARIQLSDNKTSDNLWYEETLAPDCLFAVLIAQRPGAAGAVKGLRDHLGDGGGVADRYIQIGGNASVGCGQSRWVFPETAEVLS